jgi:proteic killer suppression protein
MIRSFRCAETERIFQGKHSRKYAAIEKTALRKLIQLNQARSLHDLRSPGNSLEAMSKERVGQHAIRINEKYRLCFIWKDNEASEVEIADYH